VSDSGVPETYDVEAYDSINEFVVVGEYGFKRYEGPWSVEQQGTVWNIACPYEETDHVPGSYDEGNGVVLIADGKPVGGGLVEGVYEPDGVSEVRVIVDQYAMGEPDV